MSFTAFVKENSASTSKTSTILCRLWQRGEHFTSGTTSPEATYWVSKENTGKFALRQGLGINVAMDKSEIIAELEEGEIANAKVKGEMNPVLKGRLMLNNRASDVLVRVNSMEQKKIQIAKNQAEGKNSLLENQPDLYIQILTMHVGEGKFADVPVSGSVPF